MQSTYDAATDTRLYRVAGQVFFASAEMFADALRPARHRAPRAVIDLGEAHLWDVTAVGALEGVVTKLRRHGIEVELIGLNEASAYPGRRHAPLVQADS